MNYLLVLELFKKLDPETVGLFTRFVMEANAAPSATEYVKGKLRIALADPPVPPKHVTVEVLEQDGKPVGERAKTRVRRT